MTTTIKTSISLQKPIWRSLSQFKNKSRVINEALEMYFDKQSFLKKADELYWKNVEKSLTGDNNYISVNPKNEEVTEELLNASLWN